MAMPSGRPFTPSYFSGSSVTIMIFTAPSARMLCAIWITECPSGRSPTCWPPVMATASL
jgi:hypothetical protein